MNEIMSVSWLIFKVTLTFLLLYVFIPSKIIRLDKNENYEILDKFFIYFINANLVTIILVHLLALMNIYESISLFIGYILVSVAYLKIRKHYKNKSSENISVVASALDSIEENKGIKNAILEKIKEWVRHENKLFKYRIMKIIENPIASILIIGAFAYGAYVRFSHSFVHVYYASYDPYVHLAWTKYLGENKLYVDGVYPYGYNSIISAINKIFFLDPHTIIRFIGALGGCLIILSIFYVLKKQYKLSIIPAIIGIIVYAFSTELPIDVWRQMSALPQEYAMIFLLPGMYFLLMFFKTKKNSFLLFAGEVLALTLLIHLYVSLFLVLGYIIICLLNLKSLFNLKILPKLSATMIGFGILGALPIIIGMASGIPLHGPSIDFIVDSASAPGFKLSQIKIFEYIEKDIGLITILIASGIILLFGLVGMFYKKEKNRFKSVGALTIMFLSVFLYLQFRHEALGIPPIMEYSRTGIFLGLIGTVAIASGIGLISLLPINKIAHRILKVIAGTIVVIMVVNTSNIKLPEGIRLEYDEAAKSYMNIKSEYPSLNWTLVSTVEQYPQVIGYGWHYELWRFVLDVTTEGTSEVFGSTEYIFIFIEKYPINSDEKVTREDANMPFPEIGGNLDEYYTDDLNRRIIQAKAYYWMEEYAKKENNVSIYLETEDMIIYEIHNEFMN